jgi:hypothetical protein
MVKKIAKEKIQNKNSNKLLFIGTISSVVLFEIIDNTIKTIKEIKYNVIMS